jgi:hypothetical protein
MFRRLSLSRRAVLIAVAGGSLAACGGPAIPTPTIGPPTAMPFSSPATPPPTLTITPLPSPTPPPPAPTATPLQPTPTTTPTIVPSPTVTATPISPTATPTPAGPTPSATPRLDASGGLGLTVGEAQQRYGEGGRVVGTGSLTLRWGASRISRLKAGDVVTEFTFNIAARSRSTDQASARTRQVLREWGEPLLLDRARQEMKTLLPNDSRLERYRVEQGPRTGGFPLPQEVWTSAWLAGVMGQGRIEVRYRMERTGQVSWQSVAEVAEASG